jgi:cell division protein FtsL
MATAYRWNEELCGGGFSPPVRHEDSSSGPRAEAQRHKAAATRTVEFYTVKHIDNSRLVQRVEPVKMRNLYKMVALGGIIAAFCMLYIYQHFRCIDLSFQLEDLKAKTVQAQNLNSKLKLEIAYLRDPHRIDVIARRELGLTQPTANQMREYSGADGSEVAAMQYTRPNHTP